MKSTCCNSKVSVKGETKKSIRSRLESEYRKYHDHNKEMFFECVTAKLAGSFEDKFRSMVESMKEELKKEIKIGSSSHGECCVCPTCKYLHDDCVCERNVAFMDAYLILNKYLV